MALTVSEPSYGGKNLMGNRRAHRKEIAFDTSYAFGGESLTPANFGLGTIENMFIEDKDGFKFDYDVTNQKLRVLAYAPPIVFEENVTVTSNVGTLKYPVAAVMYVSSGNSAYKVIPSGLTPVSGSCALSAPTWGSRSTLTFLAGDSVTSCKVTYVTQAWKEVWDNRVTALLTAGTRVSGHASLSFTAGTPDVISLGEYACFIECIMWNDNGTYKPMKALYKGQTAATTEATIDYSNTSPTTTTLSVLQTDTLDASTDSVYINYIRKPTAGFLFERFVEEDDLTPSSDVVTLSSGIVGQSNALLFGAGGTFAGATTKYADILASSATVGTLTTNVQPTTVFNGANTFTFGSSHADSDHVKLSYICGDIGEIAVVPIEVANGVDLSDLSAVKAMAIGY